MMRPEIESLLPESVVEVRSMLGTGTGFVALPNGLIVTNAHVVGYAPETELRLFSRRVTVKARVVYINLARDVAFLLPKQETNARPLEISRESPARVGEPVYAVGHPLGLGLSLTRGVISSIERRLRGVTFIQTDAAISGGNSGGPLIREDGSVVGINTASFAGSDSQNLNLAIPVNEILSALDQHSMPRQAIERHRARYICPECEGDLRPELEHCPSCGARTPFRDSGLLTDARDHARGVRLVRGLLSRLGKDPLSTQRHSRTWVIEDSGRDVVLALSSDGKELAFFSSLARVPRSNHEAIYRFLLTFSDGPGEHLAISISPHGTIDLFFNELVDFLNEGVVAEKLRALIDRGGKLSAVLEQTYGAAPVRSTLAEMSHES
jgi:hypothetical protein